VSGRTTTTTTGPSREVREGAWLFSTVLIWSVLPRPRFRLPTPHSSFLRLLGRLMVDHVYFLACSKCEVYTRRSSPLAQHFRERHSGSECDLVFWLLEASLEPYWSPAYTPTEELAAMAKAKEVKRWE